MKKILALALSLLFLLTAVGCGEPQDDFLMRRAEELLPRTAVINRLFYESGIPTDPAAPVETGYRAADAAALSELGFGSLSDILSYMGEVWTQGYCDRFRASALLSPVVGDNSVDSYVYCYDAYEKDGSFHALMVSEAGLPHITDPVEYLTDTLRVSWKSRKSAKLTVDVLVTDREDGTKTQTRTVTLTLSLDTDGVWRLDSGTSVAYLHESYPLPGTR